MSSSYRRGRALTWAVIAALTSRAISTEPCDAHVRQGIESALLLGGERGTAQPGSARSAPDHVDAPAEVLPSPPRGLGRAVCEDEVEILHALRRVVAHLVVDAQHDLSLLGMPA